MRNGSRELKPFDYTWIRDPLRELLQTIEEQLKREVPEKISDYSGLGFFILIPFRLARQTFDAIAYLCANKIGEDPLPRPEFAIVVPPLNRSIADSVMSLTFLLENLDERWPWFKRAGWRQSKEQAGRLEEDLGAVPAVKEWLKECKALLDVGRSLSGVTTAEAENLREIETWPNPGRMVGYGKDRPLRTLLRRIDGLFYIDLSQQAHVSYLGVVKRGQHLLLMDELDSDARREKLKGYASDQVFLTITLMLTLCSVLDERFQLGRDGKIRYLWGLVGQYWEPAKLLHETRYAQPLFPENAD
jgi:hypothetical protein